MRPAHCVGELPLYLFQSLVGLGLPCIWGPSCFVGSVTLAVVMVMEGSLSQGAPFTGQPHQFPERSRASVPSGWGQDVGPELDPRQQTAPSQSETTAKYLPSPSYDLPLSKAPEKQWNLNIETFFWP